MLHVHSHGLAERLDSHRWPLLDKSLTQRGTLGAVPRERQASPPHGRFARTLSRDREPRTQHFHSSKDFYVIDNAGVLVSRSPNRNHQLAARPRNNRLAYGELIRLHHATDLHWSGDRRAIKEHFHISREMSVRALSGSAKSHLVDDKSGLGQRRRLKCKNVCVWRAWRQDRIPVVRLTGFLHYYLAAT